MAENATSGVAGRRRKKVSAITAAPTPRPTNPENADTKALNHSNGPTATDCTATSTGRSKKNGAGGIATRTESTTKRRPDTSATDIRLVLMSPVSPCSLDDVPSRRALVATVEARAIRKYYIVTIMLKAKRARV